MVFCLNHELLQSVGINNKDHRERILSIKSKEIEAHSEMHDTQPIMIHLKNGDQTQSKIENYDHNDEMKDESYSSDSSDSSEERSEAEDNGSDGGNNGTIEQESDDDDENEDDENGDDRDDEEFHGNRQQQSQLNYERYMQSLSASGEITSNTGSVVTPPPRKRGRPFKIRDENHPNYVKQKYKKNPKLKKDKRYESNGGGGSGSLDPNGKRKRGRPPGKKNQPKYNNFSDSDNSPNSPISVIIPTTSPNIYKKQYQHPSPSLSSSSPSVTTPISHSNSSGPFEQIVKKGRGRPKKSASGSSTTISETSSDHQHYQSITPSSSSSLSLSLSQWSNSKLKLPTDFEICNFVKDLIIENNRAMKINGTEKDDLTTSQVIRKLESYYGVDFSCRKWFLHEIVEVLAV